ncbi:MAG: anaerobic glycerol-3-phosphate dehydrogenase subunit C [SAR202 cluster bacterium]|jgi:FAD/FMN-containing dehydrogenase/Fe-S oxidoreductase|nr:MAG: anaerobic glycerol-3-phosphate dehydrogenase subunit C [SAR202 cluster bacterium]MCH2319225.1 anaerobic glycerol-3-phosphate dehydrogenase subunit C [SAR202 cluster bacterium]MQG75027.1 anaerobic glycerol-3-phosphate dehydrogenase subunit C [SAR202 cluster bacterium]
MTVQASASDTRQLVDELNLQVQGEVRFDKMSRALWSTDASIYQIEPVGVVLPKTKDDIIAVLETAQKYGVSVLPRGGGTSLAGQTVGESIVLDFSRYMRDVVEINPEEGWVRTQPGIILDELNRILAPHNVLFAPDPSTSSRGNVGGALGNNSCGAHSIMWGKTVDNVHELDVILSNGDTTTFGQLSGDSLEAKMRGSGFEGDIYRSLFEIGEGNRDEILSRYPKIQRRVSGYNLDEFVSGSNFNMARFVVGSEGTLVTITEAKLRVVPVPKYKGLAVLHCMELIESMEATVAALDLDPSAIELIGSMIIRQAQSNLSYSRITDFIEGEPEALLAIELVANSEKELAHKFDLLKEMISKGGWGYSLVWLTKDADQEKVWDVRKAGLGLMMNVPGDAKPLPFVEDTAVSPHVLPDFVRRFDSIVRKHGTEAGYYGHASVGCLHIRPLINLKNQEGIDRMVAISDEISDLVLEFGGSMSGEHGDGLVRSGYNEKMFGSQIYQAFRDVKTAFDPKKIMNPGKIVDSPPMTDNLRYGSTYGTLSPQTGFAFAEEGSFATAIEMCNGQGACRKVHGGTMCPSYMATRDEEHSTRGRANALRAAMSGAIPTDMLTSERLYQVMDLCLECKACKAECPSNVDMAKLKYEFLNIYHQENGYGLNNRFFGNVDLLSKMGAFFAPISNWMMNTSFSKQLLEKTIGIDKRRQLPNFAPQTFQQWFRSRVDTETPKNPKGMVVLFPDTTTNYNHPELGIATVNILEKLGYEVILPNSRCCGRPMLSNGMMSQAKANVDFNISSIYPFVEKGAKLVGIEPSCALGFISDFSDLASEPEKAKEISENTMLIEDFFLYATKEEDFQFTNPPQNQKVVFHGHCHQKALVGTTSAMEVLKTIPGLEPVEIKSGCCGMAGSFGFYKDHFDISMQIGEDTLFPAIREENDDVIVVSEGVSCRQQIEQGTQRKTKHLVELLSDYI